MPEAHLGLQAMTGFLQAPSKLRSWKLSLCCCSVVHLWLGTSRSSSYQKGLVVTNDSCYRPILIEALRGKHLPAPKARQMLGPWTRLLRESW